MIGLKTAVLLGCALKMGAMVAGSQKQDADLLYQFGKQAGIGFQIQDDYLDAFGDPEKFGKQVGGDIISNKKTYLIIRALEKAGPDLRAELNEIYFSNSLKDQKEKVERVKEIFKTLEVDRDTKNASIQYFENAEHCIDQLSVFDEKKELFKDFLEMLKNRSY
jgi:geranylgeranyl diphosphate synthase type II